MLVQTAEALRAEWFAAMRQADFEAVVLLQDLGAHQVPRLADLGGECKLLRVQGHLPHDDLLVIEETAFGLLCLP